MKQALFFDKNFLERIESNNKNFSSNTDRIVQGVQASTKYLCWEKQRDADKKHFVTLAVV